MGSGSVGKVAGSNYIKGLVLTYDKFDAETIQRDIAAYIKNEKLSPTSEVLYARIVGGYGAGETVDQGKIRAIAVSVQLKKLNLAYFENTSIDLSANNKIGKDTFILRLTLAPKGSN